MDREGLLRRLEDAWRELRASYAALSAAEMTLPGVAGEWSVKDVLAHVTTWEEEALKYLPLVIAGGRPPTYRSLYGGIDAFNAAKFEAKRGLPLAAVLAELDATHRRLVELLRRAPADQLRTETRFRRRLRLDTYRHYAEHAQAIRAWRRGGSEEKV